MHVIEVEQGVNLHVIEWGGTGQHSDISAARVAEG